MADYDVGIIGCGGMGHAHANAYRMIDRTNVVSAVELNEERRVAFADEFDPKSTYVEYKAMLANNDLDIISICTWPSTHAQMTVDVAKSGVDGIFCEKPMCTSLGEADTMLETVDHDEVVLTIGHQRRYHPVHELARNLIADGEIGDPIRVTVDHTDGLLNWGTHLIDLSRFILDNPETEWVMGQIERSTDRHERGVPIEDCCVGLVCFEGGIRLTVEIDLPGPDVVDAPIKVYGTEGSLEIHLGSYVIVSNQGGTTEYAPETGVRPRVAYLRDMLKSMEEDHEHRCSGRQARYTIEIMMSLYESARRNELVQTPLRTRANPLVLMIENGDLPPEHPGNYDIRIPYAGLEDQ